MLSVFFESLKDGINIVRCNNKKGLFKENAASFMHLMHRDAMHSSRWQLRACESVKIAAARKDRPVIRGNERTSTSSIRDENDRDRAENAVNETSARNTSFRANVLPVRSNLGRMNKTMQSSTIVVARS